MSTTDLAAIEARVNEAAKLFRAALEADRA